ncbi:MAG: LPP20 family lipoprotein [Nitrospirota bacterium]|nr:LPP20 family lipoprotein [Nitrospirota bacterium]
MNGRMVFIPIYCGLLALSCLWSAGVTLAESGDGSPPVSQHAERSFQQLQQTERGELKNGQAGARTSFAENGGHYPTEQYLIGKGQGDLSKGKMVCQRVSELSARTDLAKQIRVMVKEHMVDRVRERAGRETEQDTELTREEIVQEYLQGVKIVDRQIDEDAKTCSATAVMPKSQIQPKPTPNRLELTPTVIR